MSTVTMTERERFLAAVKFQQVDRLPMLTMGPRKSTIERWQSEGLAAGRNWFDAMCEVLGIDYQKPVKPGAAPGVNMRMVPTFEERVLEHKDGHYIVQDWMGNVTEISDEYDYTYIRNAIDFVTRKWHKFPVSNRADFANMKKRYDPDEPSRFPADIADRARIMEDRDYVVSVNIPGPFWQIREWCGFEPVCLMFLEDPAFIEEMTEFWTEYVAAMLERLLDKVVVDSIHISEDMAYKGASMISPQMTEERLFPTWVRWGEIVKAHGVPVYDMDSDGRVDELIPLWIKAGFDLCDPMEVAAGCDVVKYRERFGKAIAYSGGIDKREIAKGGAAIEAEMARIAPVVRDGGFIPGCDHGMPHDISWKALLEFGRLWAQLTGWL
jgi:uroporphyrinogen-III decarboxylase